MRHSLKRNKFDVILGSPDSIELTEESIKRHNVERPSDTISFETMRAPGIDELMRIREINRLKRKVAQEAEDRRNGSIR